MHKGNRKIGLGVMGWADMLVLMGIPYESERAVLLAEEIMQFIDKNSKEESEYLGTIKGVFPNFAGSVYDREGMPKVRNATTTTIAPTGTLSTIADCSSGIEPYFALAYKRFILDIEMQEINRYFFALARKRGFYSQVLEEAVVRKGSLEGIKEIPADVKGIFKTAQEISYKTHIEMQAAFQKYTDNAVSKTINLKRSATRKDVSEAFLTAYEKGCKGITIFRYGGKKRGPLIRFMDTD
jgi:ribonucleoside-diphosphate reductase alpha chain